MVGLVRLAGFGGFHPGVSLFASDLQELLLHLDEGIHAAPQQINGGMTPWAVADAFLHAGHQDFVLLLAEIEKHFLAFEKVVDALAGHFAEDGAGRMMGVG